MHKDDDFDKAVDELIMKINIAEESFQKAKSRLLERLRRDRIGIENKEERERLSRAMRISYDNLHRLVDEFNKIEM